MTVQQSRNAARPARRLSTSHGRARLDIHHRRKIVRQIVKFDTIRQSFVSRFTVAPLVAPARSQSTSSPVALKSP
jgi:hypothetical protein